jgi:hypothetical protein
MNTYFFVEVQIGAKTVIIGPYITQLQAAEIMMDHMDVVLASKNIVLEEFTARVTENILVDGQWELLAVRGEEQRSIV